MFSEDFTHYYGRHKRRNNHVIQNSVIQKTRVIHCRVDESFYKELKDLSAEKNKSISEMVRLLFENYLAKKKEIEWQKETINW